MSRKITIVLYSLKLGGAERQALNLARWLKEKGHQLEVISLTGDGAGVNILKEDGIPYRCLGFDLYHNDAAIRKNIKKLKSYYFWKRPYAVLSFTYWPNILCSLAGQGKSKPKVIWNQRDEGIGMKERPIEQNALSAADAIVANSPGGRQFLIDHYTLDAAKTHVIYNSVQLPKAIKTRDQWRSELELNERQPLVSMIANVHYYKDHPTVIRAWKEVQVQMPEHKPVVAFAGRFDFPDRVEDLRQLCRELEVEDTVKFLGGIEDVAGLLEASDLNVFSSPREGCPNGVIEPMTKGLAVVASDSSGVREAFEANYAGLVPYEDAKAMADRVVNWLQNDEVRETVGRSNRAFSHARYTVDQTGAAFLSVLGLS